MGGNALKEVKTKRLDKEQFEKCTAHVYEVLKRAFKTNEVAPIPSYESKATFGDLDMLITSEALNEEGGRDYLKRLAKEHFYSRQEKGNGNVLSFEYRNGPDEEHGFQVDIIDMPRQSFNFAYHYFAFNDLGNLMGRLANKMELKFGHEGLFLPLREGDNNYANVLITRNYNDAIEFLGFDKEGYQKGFKDVEDIFEYVANSKYFNPNIFLLTEENSNYKHRRRNAKRSTYVEFLNWCENKEGLNNFEYPEDKSMWRQKILEAFPGARERVEKTIQEKDDIQNMKERFKGEKITEWTGGYTHQALGLIMSQVRKEFKSDIKFIAWLKENDDEKLKEKVLSVKDTLKFDGLVGVPGVTDAPLTKSKEERLQARRENRKEK